MVRERYRSRSSTFNISFWALDAPASDRLNRIYATSWLTSLVLLLGTEVCVRRLPTREQSIVAVKSYTNGP